MAISNGVSPYLPVTSTLWPISIRNVTLFKELIAAEIKASRFGFLRSTPLFKKYVSISGLWASYFQIIYNNDLNTLESRKNYFSGKFSSKSEENSETFYYNLQHFIIYEKIISIKKNNMKTHEKSYISTIYCLVKNFSLQLFTFITNYF